MSEKYQLTENGVLDLETGASIPNAEGNRHWREFQAWLAEDVANIPRPIQPPFSEWVDGAWVVDIAAKESSEAQAFLAETDKAMARTMEDLIALLDADGLNVLARLPQEAQDRIAGRANARTKL